MSGAGGGIKIPKQAIVDILRDAGYKHDEQKHYVDTWLIPGTRKTAAVRRRSWFTEELTRNILGQIGWDQKRVDAFIGKIGQLEGME